MAHILSIIFTVLIVLFGYIAVGLALTVSALWFSFFDDDEDYILLPLFWPAVFMVLIILVPIYLFEKFMRLLLTKIKPKRKTPGLNEPIHDQQNRLLE